MSAKVVPWAPVVITLFTSLNLMVSLIEVLHMFTNARLSYSGQISPNLIIFAVNSLPAVLATTPVAAVNAKLYYFYLYLLADN